jgi:hypothetical protein
VYSVKPANKKVIFVSRHRSKQARPGNVALYQTFDQRRIELHSSNKVLSSVNFRSIALNFFVGTHYVGWELILKIIFY